MTLAAFKKIIADQQLICPKCLKPIKQFEKYVEKMASVWDGAGDTSVETEGSVVTLICANGACAWKERTEYWDNYRQD
jgi:hypothetical protein